MTPLAWATALFVLLALLVAFPVSAYASTGTVKIVTKQAAHEYSAYKLFACDVEGDDTISNVTTSGCMPSEFYTKAFSATNSQKMAEEAIAEVEGENASTYVVTLSRIAVPYESAVTPQKVMTGEEVSLEAGVYLLTSTQAQPILVVVGGNPVTVNEKSCPPTVTKEIAAVTKGKAADYSDAAIITSSRTLAFRITGTLPSNYGSFTTYPYEFEDTSCEALTVDKSSIKVCLVGTDGTSTVITSGYTVSYAKKVLSVAFADLKTAAPAASYGCAIVLTYMSTLDTKTAKIGFKTANPNEAVLLYTASPTYEGSGLTKTTTVHAKAYAFKIKLIKHDSDNANTLLKGAQFTLKDAQGKVLGKGVTDAKGSIVFSAIGTGVYYLVETKAPSGYNALAKPLKLTVSADASAQKLTATVSSNSGKVTGIDAASGLIKVSVGDPSAKSSSDSGLPHLPKTGDYLVYLIFILVGIAIVAALVLFATRRKPNRD